MQSARRDASTVDLIHKLRAAGRPKVRRRPGRVPAPVQPTAIENAYTSALNRAIVARLREEVERELPEIVHALSMLRREQGVTDSTDGQRHRLDASTFFERALAAIRRAARAFADKFDPVELRGIVERFGARTTGFAREQLDRQLRSAMGVDIKTIDPGIIEQISGWTKRNVDLIVTVPSRYFDRLTSEVQAAFEGGMHPRTLAGKIEEGYGVASSNAARIARDQVLTLSATVNRERMQKMGVRSYIWRTTRSNRVRDNHFELEGEKFSWSDPPMGGGTGPDDVGHPGTGIECQCWAEPVLQELIDGP